jgi:hypothetical protein
VADTAVTSVLFADGSGRRPAVKTQWAGHRAWAVALASATGSAFAAGERGSINNVKV